VISAAATVSGENELVVIGSQAILGPFPDAPETMLRSQEADLYPRGQPEKADQIEGALGDGSQFARTYGYFAHGVGPETATAPAGWEDRLVEIKIPARPGSDNSPLAYCLEPHDLILAKCAAGRDRDWEFATEALRACLVDSEELLARVDRLPVSVRRRSSIRAHLEAIIAAMRHA
jgi:hypothetical protein